MTVFTNLTYVDVGSIALRICPAFARDPSASESGPFETAGRIKIVSVSNNHGGAEEKRPSCMRFTYEQSCGSESGEVLVKLELDLKLLV